MKTPRLLFLYAKTPNKRSNMTDYFSHSVYITSACECTRYVSQLFSENEYNQCNKEIILIHLSSTRDFQTKFWVI